MISQARWPLVSAAQMRALDAHTTRALGVPAALLMETAGHSIVQVVLERFRAGEVLVVCGSGNNGGDGYVVARHLQLHGVPVRVLSLGEPAVGGDAAANLERARNAGVTVESELRLPGQGIVVDAIFGTGLTRGVSGVAAEIISKINAARSAELSVVAVDIASGIDSDSGAMLGVAICADATVAISLPKIGHAVEPGRRHAGDIQVARIGIADEAPGVEINASTWTRTGVGHVLPERPVDGHKGSFGHVLLVAGSEGKSGAAALAAIAAGRSGAGLVTVACPASLGDILEVKCTEAMTAPVAETESHGLALGAEEAILELAAERDVLAIGPGIGRADETVSLVHSLAKRSRLPMVIDADGLFAFSQDPGVLKGRQAPTILTPHPGEAARLLGGSAKDVNADRVGTARELAALTGSIVVLKGAATVTAAPSGRVAVNATGGPALATGGTGDVLTGIVAALLAQGSAPFEAASVAVYLHGDAADRCASRSGGSGLLAGDVAAELPAAAEALRVGARGNRARSNEDDARRQHSASAIDFASRQPIAARTLLHFPGN